jgi:hypothetical protein
LPDIVSQGLSVLVNQKRMVNELQPKGKLAKRKKIKK